MAVSNESKIIVMNSVGAFRYHVDVLDTVSGLAESGIVQVKPGSQAYAVALYFFPPGVFGLGFPLTYFLSDGGEWQETANSIPRIFILALVMHAVIAAAIAFWISGRRGAARKTQILWTVLGAIVGVAVLPAIIAIHAKLIYEPCPRCDKPRRIDTMVCERCGADWDRLPRDGNEVIGGWLAEKLTQQEHSA